jgi:SAM-dependent methyltransferase
MSDRQTLEESVAQAMDGGPGTGIVPFLPYILQDSWEIGTSAGIVTGLVRRHMGDGARLRVLDLGCGKGAVAVKLAKDLGCRCLGIDAIREFVDVAREKAREFGVERLCRFETGDIRVRIETLGRFDVIVLGAIGPVFGDCLATLAALSPHLCKGGTIVVDDGYLPDDSHHASPLIVKRGEMLRQIAAAGMRLAEEVIFGHDEMAATDEMIFRGLEKRCRELMALHPEKQELFADYVRRQVAENDILENKIVCAVMAIKMQ